MSRKPNDAVQKDDWVLMKGFGTQSGGACRVLKVTAQKLRVAAHYSSGKYYEELVSKDRVLATFTSREEPQALQELSERMSQALRDFMRTQRADFEAALNAVP